MRMPMVYIIIVNWNGKSDTLQCLGSLNKLDYHPFKTVVVDNGSEDESVLGIRFHYPDITIIETGNNLGYTGGNNVGIQYALDSDAEYVFLLNNDTTVDPQMLRKLVDFAEVHSSAGIVGPKQYFFDRPRTIAGTGSVIDWHRATIRHLGRGQIEAGQESANVQSPQRVDFMDGCAVCVRKNFVEQVGLLDERFHLGGYEDADWGMRAVAQGYQVWNVPEAKMWHKISATAGIGSPLTTYYMTRNALLFFWQNAPTRRRWLCTSRIILRTFRTISAWTLKPRYRTETFRRKRNANILALRDFFLRRFGPMGPDVARACFR